MEKELKIRTIYGQSYDIFKSIANEETTYLDYDLNVYAKYIIEYVDILETQLKKQQETIDKIKKLIKQYGKYDGQKCTRNFQMWTADFNKLLKILEDKEV